MYEAEVKSGYGNSATRTMTARAPSKKIAKSYFEGFGEVLSIKEQANEQ